MSFWKNSIIYLFAEIVKPYELDIHLSPIFWSLTWDTDPRVVVGIGTYTLLGFPGDKETQLVGFDNAVGCYNGHFIPPTCLWNER